ncbi:MAG: hypothetical protein HYY28_12860 [Betaproteobacteria bacterium]|nr:hypothetical protein [Betaproteobacteria bacterium]MBI2961196.1 hypothetical protein [Betaproteobacteria bacterium]
MSIAHGVLLASAVLGACAPQSALQPGSVNLSGFPPAFREGYADGCASVRGTQKRSERRFKSDQQYANGWRDGFDICRRR